MSLKVFYISENWRNYKAKIENPDFVAKYAFTLFCIPLSVKENLKRLICLNI